MLLVEVSMQEADSKQGSKEHLSASHHLVHRCCHGQQPNVHQDCGNQVKEGWDGKHEDVPGAVATHNWRFFIPIALYTCAVGLVTCL